MADPRVLIQRLSDALAEWQLGGAPPEDAADAALINEARAYLAKPEPNVLEQLSDAWCDALQADLEHGVSSLNTKAAREFHQKYKAISAFGKMLNDLYLDTCND